MSNSALAIANGQEDYTRDKIDLIKRTICAGATDDELQLFLHVAKRTGLDPMARQIHMVKRWNQKAGREVASIQTGIDGYRLIADRTGKLAGISDAEFDTESADHPGKATVTVKKLIDGAPWDFTASARWEEYVQLGKEKQPSGLWAKMPYLMLGKCAESLALRKAFPADLSGIYTTEEMGEADNPEPQGKVQQFLQQNPPAKKGPDVQRKSDKPAVANPAKLDPVICSECRVKDGHASGCPYHPDNHQAASPQQQGDAYEGPTPAQDEAAQKKAEGEKKWREFAGHDPKKHISWQQGKLLFVVQKKAAVSDEEMKSYLKTYLKVEHARLIPKDRFSALLEAIDPEFQWHERPA